MQEHDTMQCGALRHIVNWPLATDVLELQEILGQQALCHMHSHDSVAMS